MALDLAHLSLICPYWKNVLPSPARDRDPNIFVPGYLPRDLMILSRSLWLFLYPYDYPLYPYGYPLYPYGYPLYPYALPNLPFTSLPFLTIFSYQLICLAGIAVHSHRNFPGTGS